MTTAGLLVCSKSIQADKSHVDPVHLRLQMPLKTFLERNAVKCRQKINSVRRTTELNDSVRFQKVLLLQAQIPKSKLLKRCEQATNVFRSGLDP